MTYLILTSSNGTTTKLSVAPALQPVTMESCLVISGSPVRVLKVFPQKSFAALYRIRIITLDSRIGWRRKKNAQFGSTLGCFEKQWGDETFWQPD